MRTGPAPLCDSDRTMPGILGRQGKIFVASRVSLDDLGSSIGIVEVGAGIYAPDARAKPCTYPKVAAVVCDSH